MKPEQLHTLLRDVFDPLPGERVLVMVDRPGTPEQDHADWQERRHMAAEWRQAFCDLGLEAAPLLSYLATGSNNADLPETGQMENVPVPLLDTIRSAQIVVAMTEYSATAPLSRFVRDTPTLRAASMPGVLRRMEETALAADYAEVARRVHLLAERLNRADAAELTFATGHRILFDLRHRRGLGDAGECRRDRGHRLINLPSGEAFIVPYEGEREGEASRTEGEIPVQEPDGRVVFQVKANRIVAVGGEAGPAARLERWFAEDPARANVAELGLGCNPSAVVCGSVLEDEKVGLHWAYGRSEHLGGVTGPDAFRDPRNVVHQDIVYAPGCPIEADRLVLQLPDGQEEILCQNRYPLFGNC